jgi:hypothetical protein
MSSKRRNKRYVAKYEKYLGYKLDENTNVHHIDFNPKNNSVNNLVALSINLHNEYHSLLDKKDENIHRVLEIEKIIKDIKNTQDSKAQKRVFARWDKKSRSYIKVIKKI